MIVSRLLPLGRRGIFVNGIRFSSHAHGAEKKRWWEWEFPNDGPTYRAWTEGPEGPRILASCLSAFFWWWVYWHLFTEAHHVFGHNYPPDPKIWSDEELGIPADDEPDSPV